MTSNSRFLVVSQNITYYENCPIDRFISFLFGTRTCQYNLDWLEVNLDTFYFWFDVFETDKLKLIEFKLVTPKIHGQST